MANLVEDFIEAYNEGRLQSNYFIHRVARTQPYDKSSAVKNDKNLIIATIQNNIKNMKKDELQQWKKREKRQKSFIKILINQLAANDKNKKAYLSIDDDLLLIKKLNELYSKYIKKQTSVYDEKGYLDVNRNAGMKEELNRIYRHLNSFSNNEYIDFKSNLNIAESFLNLLNENIDLKEKSLILFLKNEKTDIENKIKEYSGNVKKKDSEEFLSEGVKQNIRARLNGRLELVENLLKEISSKAKNKDNLFTKNIILDNSKYHLSGLTPQTAGNLNEKIFEEILNSLFDFGNGVQAFQSGAVQRMTKEGQITYTIKTDVYISFNENVIQQMMKKGIIEKDNPQNLKDIRFSLKNYKEENSFDISAQSNNNFTSFLNILRDRDEKALSDINGQTFSNLKYFIINETVAERKGDFMSEFNNALSQLGLEVLLALNDENDEVDFLNINQCIIPSYYLFKLIYQEKEKEEKNSIKYFKVHSKSSIPTADKEEFSSDKVEKSNGKYYSENYLNRHKEYGEEQYNKIYINTKIDKTFIFNLIKELTNKTKQEVNNG